MRKELLPIYQIQDFNALAQKEQYFYFSSFASHLQEHQFTRTPHKHTFYILLFVTQGTGTHTIDFTTYDVQPDTVFVMSPGQVHSWELSADADGFVIFFTEEFYAKEYPHLKLYNYPFLNTLLYKPVLNLELQDKAILAPILKLLAEEYKAAKLLKETMQSRFLDIILIQLSRVYKAQQPAIKTQVKDHMLIQNLERLIDQHFKEHVPVNFYAELLNVTTKYLNEACKRTLGKTTNELIQYRTLLEAKRLLVHADLTTTQIAAELGYYDTTYFFRFFKRLTGCTPEQFRSIKK